MESQRVLKSFDPQPDPREILPGETVRALDGGPPKLRSMNLDFFYGSFQALHAITLNIHSKKITALIGPSGCGKSTFLRTLNRMYENVRNTRIQGQLFLDEDDILRMDVSHLRLRVGMVFQKSNPFPKSIYQNVAFGLKVNGTSRRAELDEAVEKSLRRAALWDEVKDKLHKSAFDLSGGQQQRLCIARAMAVDPEVLLLDEPCSALDPIATGKIEELLFQIKNDCTVVIVTHNMQQAARVADFTGFFLLGKLIEFDTTKIIFETPKVRATEDYITGRFG